MVVCKSKESNREGKNQKQEQAENKTKNVVKSPNHYLEESGNDNNSINNMYYKKDTDNSEILDNVKSLKVSLMIGNKALVFEIDTRSPISAISQRDFEKFKSFENAIMRELHVVLEYTRDPIIPLGTLKVKVEFKNKKRELELFVLPGRSISIVGRNWLQVLEIMQFKEPIEKLSIKAVSEEPKDISNRFESLFSRKLRPKKI